MSSAGVSRNPGLSSLYISHQEIEKDKWLGKGGFGIVYLGKWAHANVAIKELMVEPEELSEDDQLEFEREVQVMRELRHPNVVLLYGTCTQPKYCLVMEYCARGSLAKLLKSAEQIE